MSKKLLASAAHLKWCDDGYRHIVYADGALSKELTSVAEALEQVEVDLHEGRIIAQEQPELERQIRLSESHCPPGFAGAMLGRLIASAIVGGAILDCLNDLKQRK